MCLCLGKREYELTVCRIVEEEIETAIESRNEALQTIRELGPLTWYIWSNSRNLEDVRYGLSTRRLEILANASQ